MKYKSKWDELTKKEKDIVINLTKEKIESDYVGSGEDTPKFEKRMAIDNFERNYDVVFQFKRNTVLKRKKGWKFESARHSLARKGIKTGRKKK